MVILWNYIPFSRVIYIVFCWWREKLSFMIVVKFNSNKIYLQIGAFKEKKNALNMKKKVSSEGVKNVYIEKSRLKRQVIYRVQIGPIKSIDRYDQIASLLASLSLDMDLVSR